jgi:Flp pilus assembly pilin Flp
MRVTRLFAALHQDESGQDLVEYALVLAAIAFAVVATSGSLRNVISNALTSIDGRISSAVATVS